MEIFSALVGSLVYLVTSVSMSHWDVMAYGTVLEAPMRWTVLEPVRSSLLNTNDLKDVDNMLICQSSLQQWWCEAGGWSYRAGGTSRGVLQQLLGHSVWWLLEWQCCPCGLQAAGIAQHWWAVLHQTTMVSRYNILVRLCLVNYFCTTRAINTKYHSKSCY